MSETSPHYSTEEDLAQITLGLQRLSVALPLEVGHIPTSNDLERQSRDAEETIAAIDPLMRLVVEGMESIIQNGQRLCFNESKRAKIVVPENDILEREYVFESQPLDKPLVLERFDRPLITTEQISRYRLARSLSVLAITQVDGVPREERITLVDHDGNALWPIVLPADRWTARRSRGSKSASKPHFVPGFLH